ncbi:peroxisomal assembly protein [Globodera pallida]|nr:peroxisomal assembly protein [Globodera pallida]
MADERSEGNAAGLLSVYCYSMPMAQTLLDHLESVEQQSAVFVDAGTWLRWRMRSCQLYELSFSATNYSSQQINRFTRISFVRPLPIAVQNYEFAIFSPFTAFNLFGISSIGTELVNVVLEKANPIESVQFAPTIRIKLIEHCSDSLPYECAVEPQQEMSNFFRKPRLLYDGDLFDVSANPRNILICKANFACHPTETAEGGRQAQLVQRGVSCCIEDLSSSNNPFPGRFPQLNVAQHPFLPRALTELVGKLAKLLWPLFVDGNECKVNPLILFQANFESSKLAMESLCCQLDVRLRVIDCLQFLSNEMEGQNSEKIVQKFNDVQKFTPCICWIRDVEVLFPGEEATQRQDKLDVLIRCLKAVKSPADTRWPSVFFLNISPMFNTNEVPERLAKAFHWEFRLEEDDERMGPEERMEYAEWALKNGPLEWAEAQLVDKVVESTKGFSLLQLIKLFDDAECVAIGEQQSFSLDNLPRLGFEHFKLALKRWETASARREGISEVDMDDIGGLDDAKQLLSEALAELVNEHNSSKIGAEFLNRLRRRTGILLHGPPGCGKTMLAKAVANQAGLSFISVKGPELLSQFVGESERNLREVFARAKRLAPSVLFFDELDSLAPARGGNSDSGGVMDRMVSQFLTELDSCQWSRSKAVFIMGATNRPDLLDRCLLTPGRFDKLVPINPATDLSSKERILGSLCKKIKLADGFSVRNIALKCPETMSGAELAGLITSASMNRLRELIELAELEGKRDSEMAPKAHFALSERHFDMALAEMQNWRPSK